MGSCPGALSARGLPLLPSLRTNSVKALCKAGKKTGRSRKNLTATASRELGLALGFWGDGGCRENLKKKNKQKNRNKQKKKPNKKPQPTDVSRLSVPRRHRHKTRTQRRARWSAGGLARKKTTRRVTAEALRREAVSARRWRRASRSASPGPPANRAGGACEPVGSDSTWTRKARGAASLRARGCRWPHTAPPHPGRNPVAPPCCHRPGKTSSGVGDEPRRWDAPPASEGEDARLVRFPSSPTEMKAR